GASPRRAHETLRPATPRIEAAAQCCRPRVERSVDQRKKAGLKDPPYDYRLTLDYAAACDVDAFPRTSPNTATAFFISSIVPNEMRQCVFSNGGKSRATRTFF